MFVPEERLRNVRRPRLIGLMVIALVLALAGVGGVVWNHYRPWQAAAAVGAKGGSAWAGNHGVGVRVTATSGKATHLTFTEGEKRQKRPLDSLTDQIGDAVDIKPDHNIANASQVMFKVPSRVPTNVDCNRDDPKRPRSICNAGIEVYNTTMQGWVPLPTTIEHGNVLVAEAPHYSEYRAVWAKVGDVTLSTFNGLVAHFKNDTTPDVILAKATGAFFTQLFNNLTGQLDHEKTEPCEKSPDKDFLVDFKDANDNIKPCVVKQGDATKLLVADGLALPIAVTADAPHGVTPDRNTEAELTIALRNLIASKVAGGKTVIVSGLDTGTFTIDPNNLSDANGKLTNAFSVKTSVSWTAVGGDYLIAALTLFFPEERVAEQVDKLVDAADCMTTGFQKIPGMAAGNIPDLLAETLKNCALPVGLEKGWLAKLGVHELGGLFLKFPKLIAESWQIGTNISTYLRTGKTKGDSTFNVTSIKAFTGHWINQCPGRMDAIDFLHSDADDDSWVQQELGPDNKPTDTRSTYFEVEYEEGHLYMKVKETDMPGIKAGQKLELHYDPPQGGYSAFLTISGNELWFFWNDNNGIAPCD